MSRNGKFGRALAWLVTASLLVFLFLKYPLSEVVGELRRAAPWTLPAMVGFVLLIFLADSFAAWRTFSWFATPVGFRETLLVRGASYPLALVNYAVGQGAFAYFLKRTRGTSLLRSTSIVLLVMGTNLLLLLFLATGSALLGAQLPDEIAAHLPFPPKTILIVAYAGLVLYAALVVTRPRWLRERPVFDVLLSAGLGGYARALLVRAPHVALLILFFYAYLHGFGVPVPLADAVLMLPMVFVLAVLPLSVQGLGVTQATMSVLFAPYGPARAIVAASLAAQVVTFVVQSLLGLFCLRSPAIRGLARAATAEDAAA